MSRKIKERLKKAERRIKNKEEDKERYVEKATKHRKKEMDLKLS